MCDPSCNQFTRIGGRPWDQPWSPFAHVERAESVISEPRLIIIGTKKKPFPKTQHSALSTQHSALSTQHSAHSTQHSALSTQHSALSTQHSALSTQHSRIVYLAPLSTSHSPTPAL